MYVGVELVVAVMVVVMVQQENHQEIPEIRTITHGNYSILYLFFLGMNTSEL